ncbi:hypothetical protein PFICI_03222 [Pestalotiopsis fici W106-1]|uniref:Transcription factor domain-containing protein n=1 Tax=Pestalotiopsis fici (strain W106-1 / CGMCC3.15140) TaxID=1229662 RepID=W3XIC7_PESFW|nr:uncharacterized protein PFICI_03222 [Pestalotiopsis fici W106-1]ETS85197.1 hypothetical protein PFICI_03222 [Pestalotiopsis fici W106-1]
MLEVQDDMLIDAPDGIYMAGMGWDFFNSPTDTFHFERDLEFHFDENFGNLNFQISQPNQSSTLPVTDLAAVTNGGPNLLEASKQGPPLDKLNTTADTSGYEAFKRSPWLWTPVRHDHAYAEGSQLSVNEVQMMESPEVNEICGTDDIVPKAMDPATRDEIFSLVLKFSSSEVNIRSFPSFRLLNVLMQAFFVKESASATPWLHVFSFEPDSVKSELIASIVAAGATLFAVPDIWKMGLALQEIVKLASAAAIDEDNRRVRDLQSIQAFWMWIKIGLWSGFRRKMEIAEGFAHTVPTMLRRAGAFRQNRYTPAIFPATSDNGEVLKQKWLKWIEQESFKRQVTVLDLASNRHYSQISRLVLQIMMNEMKSSIAFTRNPLFSGTEIAFSLPAAQDLWDAQDETEWRDRMIAKSGTTTTSTLMDGMHDPCSLENEADIVDVGFASHAILIGLWGRVYSFLDSKAFYLRDNSDSHASSSLWLEAQRQELYLKIQSITTKLGWLLPLSSEARLVSEFLMMSLYVSSEDIQRIAGRYGEDDFQKSLPVLDRWNNSKDGRYARWHAGQVLKAARSFPPTQLDAFNGIATYHACLVLWVGCALKQRAGRHIQSGQVMQPRPATNLTSAATGEEQEMQFSRPANSTSDPTKASKRQTTQVILDGEETSEVRSYLAMGVGQPCLHMSNRLVEFEEPAAVSKVLSDIFRANFPSKSYPLPPMLENLDSLMAELCRSHFI